MVKGSALYLRKSKRNTSFYQRSILFYFNDFPSKYYLKRFRLKCWQSGLEKPTENSKDRALALTHNYDRVKANEWTKAIKSFTSNTNLNWPLPMTNLENKSIQCQFRCVCIIPSECCCCCCASTYWNSHDQNGLFEPVCKSSNCVD